MRVLYSPVRSFVLFFYDADARVESVEFDEKGEAKLVLKGQRGNYELRPLSFKKAIVAGLPLWLTATFALWITLSYLRVLIHLPLTVSIASLVGYLAGFYGGFLYQKLKKLKVSHLLVQMALTMVFFVVAMLWSVYPFNLYVVGVFSGLLFANAYFLIKGLQEERLYVTEEGLIVVIL